MIDIKIAGLEELKATLTGFSDRRFAAAIATALTRTAVSVRGDMARRVEQSFDRPTPYTMKQLRYVGASADRLVSAVGFNIIGVQDERGKVLRYEESLGGNTRAMQYMAPHVQGGARPAKRLEAALQAINALPNGWMVVPASGAPLDSYGNVSRGTVVQILSQLRVTLVAGTTRNMSQDARKQIAAQRKAGGRYFVMPIGSKARAGIYQREFIGKNITPVFWFINRATYRKRFDFAEEANALAQRTLPGEVTRSISEHQRRLAGKA